MSRPAPFLTLLVAFALPLAVGGCGEDQTSGSGGAGGTSASIEVKTFIFRPKPLEVRTGTTVTWTNHDAIVHSVTAGTRAHPKTAEFDGDLAESNGTFRHRFDVAGTYRYFCKYHPGSGMTGTVRVVRPAR
jgi:plastocyanin